MSDREVTKWQHNCTMLPFSDFSVAHWTRAVRVRHYMYARLL